MSKGNETWVRFVMKVALLGVVVMVAAFAGNRLANARPGVAGGTARTFVTVAGSITGLTGTQSATFHFRRRGETRDLCAPRVDIAIGAGGAFAVEVPLDEMATRCPETMFDGSDVVVNVDLPGHDRIVREANINPVPYAVYAQQYGTPDCPVGYERNPATPSGRTYCRMALASGNYDEVVRVGTGSSAFWIDRFEAMVCDSRDGACSALINSRGESDLTSRGLPRNGQWAGQTPPLFAISIAASNPPARWVTWFQAEELCRAAGKRLPTGSEWLSAARGTGGATGDVGCQVSATEPRNINAGGACVGDWGAQDMVGNVMEWTAEWYAAPAGPAIAAEVPDAWGMDYGSDSTRNIISTAFGSGAIRRVPAAALRGGHFGSEAGAGVFSLNLGDAPSNWLAVYGFRCVIPR